MRYSRFENEKDNEEIYEFYCNEKNYDISICGGDKAFIFFTGHGLYYPTTIEEFRKSVVEADRYEWKNVSENKRIKSQANIFVFVRDVYKNWCIDGINSTINSQDKLYDKLKELVGNREVITVGSSAGGYMAILFGILLKAVRIYSFSPQVNLYEYYIDHPYTYYDQYCQNASISKYMDLKPLINSFNGTIYYWYPARYEEDLRQYNCICDCEKVRFFALDQSKHGSTLWGESIISSLCMAPQKLDDLSEKYSNKVISPFVYCKDTSGVIKAVTIMIGKKAKTLIKH